MAAFGCYCATFAPLDELAAGGHGEKQWRITNRQKNELVKPSACKRTERNRGAKSHVKTAVRAFREALAGDQDKTIAVFKNVTRELRKVPSKGTHA
ncbi:MAG: 30S ribosomal protein S20 [Myxococcota bacterium]